VTTVLAQVYCTLGEMCADLDVPGAKNEKQALRFIRSASQWLNQHGGMFLPVTETRRMNGSGHPTQWIDPIVEITSLRLDGAALSGASDYVLMPQSRLWEDGPYISIELVTRGIWPNVIPNEVEITGRWGVYDLHTPLSAYATQISEAETLEVDNAADVSPGAIVLIDTEQESIDSTAAPLDSGAQVDDDSLDSAVEIFDVDDATLLHVGEIIRIDFEQMLITDMLTNTLLVTRGYNGTTRAEHDDKTAVYVYRAFNVTRAVNGTISANHMSDRLYRVLPPHDVNYLCRQMAALMWRKSAGGYASKWANSELGEVFYSDEFPTKVIDAVLNNYRIVTV
jgi:hypothetical protein